MQGGDLLLSFDLCCNSPVLLQQDTETQGMLQAILYTPWSFCDYAWWLLGDVFCLRRGMGALACLGASVAAPGNDKCVQVAHCCWEHGGAGGRQKRT